MESNTVILVVDDDPDVRATILQALCVDGITAIGAGSGDEALRILAGDLDVEVLITDIMMPGISGIILAERAAALRPGLKTIFISGYSAVGHPPGMLLRKPFRIRELRATLGAVMGRS